MKGTFKPVMKYNMLSDFKDSTLNDGILCAAKGYEGISLFNASIVIETTENNSLTIFWFYIPLLILMIPLARKRVKGIF